MKGFSLAVPTMTIGWPHKYDEFMRLLGCENFNLRHDIPDTQSIASEFLLSEENLRCNYLSGQIFYA